MTFRSTYFALAYNTFTYTPGILRSSCQLWCVYDPIPRTLPLSMTTSIPYFLFVMMDKILNKRNNTNFTAKNTRKLKFAHFSRSGKNNFDSKHGITFTLVYPSDYSYCSYLMMRVAELEHHHTTKMRSSIHFAICIFSAEEWSVFLQTYSMMNRPLQLSSSSQGRESLVQNQASE